MMQEMTAQEFAAMPGLIADSTAEAALARTADLEDKKKAIVVKAMAETGVEIVGPFNWRYFQRSERSEALIVVHNFSAPSHAEADISLICNHFSFNHSNLQHIAEWLAWDLSLRKLRVTIPLDDPRKAKRLECLAQRVGFRLAHHAATLTTGRPVSVWALGADDLLLFSMKVKP